MQELRSSVAGPHGAHDSSSEGMSAERHQGKFALGLSSLSLNRVMIFGRGFNIE